MPKAQKDNDPGGRGAEREAGQDPACAKGHGVGLGPRVGLRGSRYLQKQRSLQVALGGPAGTPPLSPPLQLPRAAPPRDPRRRQWAEPL